MSELRPKLFEVMKGYTKKQAFRDILAGIIVAIIALPLSIALAIASGVGPEQGLYTAIIAGFFISFFGGSRVQIGGPTAAFVVIVYGIVKSYGTDGLIIATILSGIILVIMAVCRFGSLIRYIPYTITTGFTCGIAVTLFAGQLKDFLGLQMESVPSEFVEKLAAYGKNITTINWLAFGIGALALVIMILWPKVTGVVPGSLIAIIVTTLAAVLLVVAWNMADWSAFAKLCRRAPKSDMIVLVVTFVLTVFFDLVIAIEVGVVLAALLFMKRMADTADIKAWKYIEDPDVTEGEAEKLRALPHSIKVFEISGPMFFAAADRILQVNSDKATKIIVVRMRSVPAIDISALRSLRDVAERCKKKGITLIFSHVNEQPMSVMKKADFYEFVGEENFKDNIVEALDYAEGLL